MRKLIAILLIACAISSVSCLDNGLAKTPAMGWNSWNHFACNINEDLIKATADQIVNSGLAALGYNYINLDDCWQISRDADGYIVEDKEKFPSGIKALADYVHSKGLKFGLYSDAGEFTCQKRPGSLGYEVKDAQRYAEWEVDYLKYDNCFNKNINPKIRYPPMRDALNATGRPIYFSMCEWGQYNPATWAPEVGNSWRTTGDIKDRYSSFLSILEKQVGLEKYAHPGAWNDPDMLEVGNGGMTTHEYEAHFALWALLKAPLLIGCDVSKMSEDTIRILTNKEIIAINQDPLGIQGHRVKKSGFWFWSWQLWMGQLEDGVAIILFNTSAWERNLSFTFKEVGIVGPATIRDLYQHEDLGVFSNSFSAIVPKHGVVVVKVVPV
ncbi:alpha-galactosidase (macronuclear) [Tetrahymena thermophila SB210]|uniref:Alpha-galactosidase n=1 Tax=Tetrahymena thermophila (strain SB210) TaxID=312017 RepID=Q23DW6_TETTS|nr:alpha-galactosidase [Tetrahymena thermophila SB210]EAR94452.1 alpha-galactosidase [Tetrahymena thermophila SB210]|eukprot:XP_001014570.1 alpha-galactosidase [Tetrahymena thermophila SB210]